MTQLQTIKGRTFNIIEPTAEMIDPDEICTVLARIPRFGGHTLYGPYSVAQHSLLVESLVTGPFKLGALLHDAHEVYSGLGDVQSPVKRYNLGLGVTLGNVIAKITWAIDGAICDRFGISLGNMRSKAVDDADDVVLATERRDLLCESVDPAIWRELPEPAPERIRVMSCRQAEDEFRKRLGELWKG